MSMVSLVDIAAGNVINIDFLHPRGDSCYPLVKDFI